MLSVESISGINDSYNKLIESFKAVYGAIPGYWYGTSSDHFYEICDDFFESTKALGSQFVILEEAVSNYNAYIDAINKYYYYVNCYNNSSTDDPNRGYYCKQGNYYADEVKRLKSSILSGLDSIDHIIIEGGVGMTSVGAASSTIQAAIDWAINTAADDSVGYSQQTRWGNPNYDCSSFVISAYQNAGVDVKGAGAGYTGNMRSAFTQTGFEWIPYSKIDSGEVELQAGDVLLDEDQHTEMYIGDNQNVGAHSNYDGVNGDSSGREVSVSGYYRGTWDGVLRYVGPNNSDKDDD